MRLLKNVKPNPKNDCRLFVQEQRFHVARDTKGIVKYIADYPSI